MKLALSFAAFALAALTACEGKTDDNIAAAAGEQAEGMAAQAGNEIEAAGDAIANGAAEFQAEIDPGRDGAEADGNRAEAANRQ
jgi:hypothetical protein